MAEAPLLNNTNVNNKLPQFFPHFYLNLKTGFSSEANFLKTHFW